MHFNPFETGASRTTKSNSGEIITVTWDWIYRWDGVLRIELLSSSDKRTIITSLTQIFVPRRTSSRVSAGGEKTISNKNGSLPWCTLDANIQIGSFPKWTGSSVCLPSAHSFRRVQSRLLPAIRSRYDGDSSIASIRTAGSNRPPYERKEDRISRTLDYS